MIITNIGLCILLGLHFIIDFAKTDFECPHCKAKYSDADDKYLKRCEKNKSWATKINCKCGKPFFMTYDYKGDAVSFVYFLKIKP